MLIRYVCECCDRLVEEVMLSEELVYLLNEEDAPSSLTDLSPEDIMNLETQGSLVLETTCPECLAEITFEDEGTLAMKPQIIN